MCTLYQEKNKLVVASKDFALEVNADKTKNVVMSSEQTAGRLIIVPLIGSNS